MATASLPLTKRRFFKLETPEKKYSTGFLFTEDTDGEIGAHLGTESAGSALIFFASDHFRRKKTLFIDGLAQL